MQNIPTLSILLIIGSLFIVLSISEQMSISNTLIKINNKLAKIFLFVIGVVFILFSLIHLFSIDIDLGNINIGKSSIKHEDINEIMIKARAGDSHYQAILGANYRRGYQVKQSFPLAKEWLKKSLKATDNPIALYNMAYLYQHGQGVKKDLNKSQNLYAKSYIGLVELSKSGDIRAKVNLGAMYRDGNGIIQDPKKALVLFKEANNKNYYLAQFTLANLYETSELVKTSCEKAISLYKKSAMQNYVLAAYALGGIYWGKGKCSKNVQIHDINKSIEWYTNAANKGHIGSQLNLGSIYLANKNPELAIDWYKKAAYQNSAKAEYNIGWIYQGAIEGFQDKKQAFRWYKKSYDHGFTKAAVNLAYLLFKGQGTQKNHCLSLKLAKEASDKGISEAQEVLSLLSKRNECPF